MENEKSQIESIAMRCVKVCEEKKAADIVLFDKSKDSILADYYLVCCGTSLQHVRALAENVRRALIDEGIRPRGQEGVGTSQWIVLDYGVILVHIMTPDMRRRYCLEDLWDKELIVYQGGEELPPPSENVDPQWEDDEEAYDEDIDGDDEFDDDDYDDEFDDEDGDFDDEDGEFEDDDDDDDDYDDFDEDDVIELDEEEADDEPKSKSKKSSGGKGDITLKDLFKD